MDFSTIYRSKNGRGALMSPHYCGRGCEGRPVRATGAASSENAGLSNEKVVKTYLAENPRVPPQRQSTEG